MGLLRLLVFVLALLGFIMILGLLLRKMGANAEGWRVRCTSCGRTRPADNVGIIRMGAISRLKYTLGRCSHCGGVRFMAIESDPGTDKEVQEQTTV